MSDEQQIPGLTRSDSRWLIRECQRVLTDLGHPSTVIDGPTLQIADGRTFGLGNLARTVRMEPRKAWSRLVREQFHAMIEIDPTAPIRPEDLRVKLVRPEEAELILTYEPLEPLPGMKALLGFQGDRVNTYLGKLDQLEQLDLDRDAAYDVALSNMHALPLPRHTRRRLDPHDPTSWVEFLEAADSYGASRVAVLPELMRRVLGRGIPACGVLVAVPTKWEIWLHLPVNDGVIDIATCMAYDAYQVWAREPYALTPHIFWVSPDMHAQLLMAPDHEGCTLDQWAALELLDAVLDEDAAAG